MAMKKPRCPYCKSILKSLTFKKGTAGKNLKQVTVDNRKYCENCDKVFKIVIVEDELEIVEVKKGGC